ncbi:MAG: rhamnulokinase family protein [Planctomycetota bacterium]
MAHLAFDLGASSGRAILGIFDNATGKLLLEEVHRFEHFACPTPAGPVWDLTGIWRNILIGLRKGNHWCRSNDIDLLSVGVDTWGVDWALLGESGELLSLPHCYRDPQNEIACQRVLDRVGGMEKLFERTGIQLMSINTLFQVAARHEKEPGLFDAAKHFVFLPDLFHFWLSGEIANEVSIASTSSMLQVNTGDWDAQLLDQFGLPTDIFGPIIDSGTVLGDLRDEVANEADASSDIKVVTPASHDTASAIAAVPASSDGHWAYLSSGTWSLLGAELDHPIATPEASRVPLTNERGVESSIRLLKNIAGLWLVQELRRELQQSGEPIGFGEMVELAREAEPFRTIVDPNFSEFAAPGNMCQKLRDYASRSNQPVPQTTGQLVRCCLESLALCYAETVEQLEGVVGISVDVLHIVGGGTQNALLNELTAAAVERPVITGPVEATAIGNVLVQAIGCGKLAGLTELRQVVGNSFDVNTIEAPADNSIAATRDRYRALIAG